jgi:hypothetical protein
MACGVRVIALGGWGCAVGAAPDPTPNPDRNVAVAVVGALVGLAGRDLVLGAGSPVDPAMVRITSTTSTMPMTLTYQGLPLRSVFGGGPDGACGVGGLCGGADGFLLAGPAGGGVGGGAWCASHSRS